MWSPNPVSRTLCLRARTMCLRTSALRACEDVAARSFGTRVLGYTSLIGLACTPCGQLCVCVCSKHEITKYDLVAWSIMDALALSQNVFLKDR